MPLGFEELKHCESILSLPFNKYNRLGPVKSTDLGQTNSVLGCRAKGTPSLDLNQDYLEIISTFQPVLSFPMIFSYRQQINNAN
jgi:hypothetical protein